MIGNMKTALIALFACVAIAAIPAGCSSSASTQPTPLHLESRSDDGSEWTLDEIKLQDAPLPVRATLKEVLGDHDLRTLHRETVDGRSTYEAEYDDGGIDHAVLLSEDGQIAATSYDIQAEVLPQAVRQALWDRFPKGDWHEVQSVKAGDQNYFIALIAEADVVHKVRISPTGQIQEVASWLQASEKK